MKPRCALRILFGVGMVILFSCQQEEFRIVQKSECFKRINPKAIPEEPGFGFEYEEGNHHLIRNPIFHPYREETLVYTYFPDPATGNRPVLASYDFATGQSRIITEDISRQGYAAYPQVSSKDWIVFLGNGLKVIKLNGDSLSVLRRGLCIPIQWTPNGDTLYFFQQNNYFKSYLVGGTWMTESVSMTNPLTKKLVWSEIDQLFYRVVGNEIIATDITNQVVDTIVDPLGIPDSLQVWNGGLFWITNVYKGTTLDRQRMVVYRKDTRELVQLREFSSVQGYVEFVISPNGEQVVATWITWKIKDKVRLIQYFETRIMDIEGCNERELVLPEPQ